MSRVPDSSASCPACCGNSSQCYECYGRGLDEIYPWDLLKKETEEEEVPRVQWGVAFASQKVKTVPTIVTRSESRGRTMGRRVVRVPLNYKWDPKQLFQPTSPPPSGEGWQVWETVTETGSPVTPVFSSDEALATYLWNHGDEEGYQAASFEAAMGFIAAGSAPTGLFIAPNPEGPYSPYSLFGLLPVDLSTKVKDPTSDVSTPAEPVEKILPFGTRVRMTSYDGDGMLGRELHPAKTDIGFTGVIYANYVGGIEDVSTDSSNVAPGTELTEDQYVTYWVVSPEGKRLELMSYEIEVVG